MSEQHTPGRLTLLPGSKTTIYTADEHEMFVASCGTGEKQRNRETKANARRLAACWNLLADVPTKEIEAAANYGSSWGKTGLELAAVTAELDELKAENARLRAELEAVGAGGVQPLRAEAGWVLVPVEPTQEMLEAAVQAICYGPGGGFTRIGGPHRCWSAMLTAAPVPRPAPRNPQGTPAPQQETPVVRALQSAILSGLSHEELLEKAHHLMTLTVNQARTIGELQEAAAAEAAPQQAAPAQEGGEA